MHISFRNFGSPAAFILYSLLAHLGVSLGLGWTGPFVFSEPVPLLPAISIDLSGHAPGAAGANAGTGMHRSRKPAREGIRGNPQSVSTKNRGISVATAKSEGAPLPDETAHPMPEPKPVVSGDMKPSPALQGSQVDSLSPPPPGVPVSSLHQESVRRGDEFVPRAHERLTYRIDLYGVPVGTAVVDATNRNGEVRITTRITSNAFLSGIYPVDVSVDTRLIKGNYLLTRIRQHEGDFTGDSGFTLMLRERNAFWVDRLHNRYANHPLPREDVMDVVSGFYFLRSQPLEVGRQVVLHLFDSNEYDPTSVEVLRKERLHLNGLREVDTLVVHPVLKTAGFFRRTGDLFIWLTNDTYRVPVRVETSIPLGRVTAELVSIEGEKEGGGAIPSYAETLAGE